MKDYHGFKHHGSWYKGNLHCHTTMSDGEWTPERAVEEYKNAGYQFLALSEHDLYLDVRETFDREGFITIPAFEWGAVLYCDHGTKKRFQVHHLHGILGTKKMQNEAPKPPYQHMEAIPKREYYKTWDPVQVAQEMADELKAHGMIVTYNHPVWSRVTSAEFMDTKGLDALEIYNYCGELESATGDAVMHWDEMLRAGKKIHGFASDDNHNVLEDSFGGWIVVQASELTHEAIVENFLEGNYYSSSGPEIFDWGIKDGKAWISCSNVNQVRFIAGNIINDGFVVIGEKYQDNLTGGEYQLKGHESYVRAEARDKYGRTAWTNPIYLDEEEETWHVGE